MEPFSRLDLCVPQAPFCYRLQTESFIFLFFYIVYSTSRALRLSTHSTRHAHTWGSLSQSPTHHVSKLQALLLLGLGPRSLSLGPLPVFPLTCIFSVTCCPVPSSHLRPAGNQWFLKSWACLTSTPKSPKTFPMSPFVRFCLSRNPLPLQQRKEGGVVATKDLRGRKKRRFAKKTQWPPESSRSPGIETCT